MSVEPIQIIHSSKIFGGTNESISVYEDRLIIYIPNQQGNKTEELYYSQIADVYLFRGLLYITVSFRTHSGYSLMVRWLPKRRAIRVADYVRQHI
jgi:Bacterial PH domain